MMASWHEDRLFTCLVCIFGAALFIAITLTPNPGPQRTEAIEIDMADLPMDSGRNIPVPRHRAKSPSPVKPRLVQAMAPPKVCPVRAAAVTANTPTVSALANSIGDMPALSGPQGVALSASDAMAGFMGQNDYFELLKMRVDALKVYPLEAKTNRRQGQVVVRFVLHKDGMVSAISIFKSSGSLALDEAATRAVKKAAPFPCPPSGLFDMPVRLQVGVQFMLT